MYIEHCNSIKERGNIIPMGKLQIVPRDNEYYISLFPFDSNILEYVKMNGTIKGYKGKHYCPYICIDIDNDDLNVSQESAISFIKKLSNDYLVSTNYLQIFFSGSKGFHINISQRLFGDIEPREDMASIIKNIVAELSIGLDNIDPKIYENHRIIRVENSLNLKSNLYKIQLSYKELTELDINDIKDLAKEPREFIRTIPISNTVINERLKKLIYEHTNTATDENNNVIDTGFFLPPNKGNRNNQLYKQACTLFMNSTLHEKSIFEILKSINLSIELPIDDFELQNIVRSAKFARKQESDSTPPKFTTLSELIPLWIDNMKSEKHKISLNFPTLDNEFHGKLRGKLGVFIGYGGSRKSLFAQNVAFCNMILNNRTVYSNMEMSEIELTSRFIDLCFEADNSLPHIELEDMYRSKEDINPIIKEHVIDRVSNNILISNDGGMTVEKYDSLLKNISEKHGSMDLLIVDGLSMMGGKGTELEQANMHSKELKELAKRWNIYVMLIVHASKGEELTTLDLTKKARASEKIIDNCDFVATMSLISKNTDEYYDNVGGYLIWNKRGSGRKIKGVYKFKEKNLVMWDSPEDIDLIDNQGNKF